MAFTIRVFGYRGLEQLHVNLPKQFSSDAVYQLVQPYEWRQALVSNGLVAVLSAPQAAPDATGILRVEVPDSQAIRYEMGPSSRNVPADANSPLQSGVQHYYFKQGWVFSFIDAANT